MREEQLRYVLEVARCGSVNKAAEKLFISHQSLDRSLRNMEEELDLVLFYRSAKGLEPTLQGRKALELIQKIVILYDELYALEHIEKKPYSKIEHLRYLARYIFAIQ